MKFVQDRLFFFRASYNFLRNSLPIRIVFFLFLSFSTVYAGNPFVTDSGSLLFWPNRENRFMVDSRALGPYSPILAKELVIKAFNEWSTIRYSQMTWEYGGTLESEFDADLLQLLMEQPGNAPNPIIFDSNGFIVDSIQGNGASQYSLGFAVPIYKNTGEIVSSFAVINGNILSGEPEEIQELYATILHEVGHFIGIGHSQLHLDFAFDSDSLNNLFLPIMFPVAPEDGVNPPSLSLDDKMTLASLYPAPELFEQRGIIQGSVTTPFGYSVQGANVVVKNVNDPFVTAFSVVSDLEIRNTGDFSFWGLPRGEYEIFIESIHQDFHGVSAVGPFSSDTNAPSFINPVEKEYYNGVRESGSKISDDPEDRVLVTVKEGETVNGIDFISNEESTNILDWSLY